MGRLRRKKMHKGDKPIKEKYRTKRKTKDHDQIHDDLKPGTREKLLNQEVDHDKAGSGQHYCITCAKHFINEVAIKDHFKGKPHKRRFKALETEPYTQAEAERAGGLGSYIQPKKVVIPRQDLDKEKNKDKNKDKMDESDDVQSSLFVH